MTDRSDPHEDRRRLEDSHTRSSARSGEVWLYVDCGNSRFDTPLHAAITLRVDAGSHTNRHFHRREGGIVDSPRLAEPIVDRRRVRRSLVHAPSAVGAASSLPASSCFLTSLLSVHQRRHLADVEVHQCRVDLPDLSRTEQVVKDVAFASLAVQLQEDVVILRELVSEPITRPPDLHGLDASPGLTLRRGTTPPTSLGRG